MTGTIRDRLRAAGFRPDEVIRRAGLFERVERGLGALGGGPWRLEHVPGRIEVLGKHTDYAGGRSLVCATEQGLAVAWAPRDDDRLAITDAGSGDRRVVAIDPTLIPPRSKWVAYPITVAARLARDFGPGLRGADLVFASDLPIAAGVSSSSALVVAIARVVIARNDLAAGARFREAFPTREDLAGYFGAVENGRPFHRFEAASGVGTLGGSQDQTAIVCARPDALSQFRFDPVRFERAVEWPETLEFAIASSGVVAEKTGAALEKYNALARETALLRDLVVEGDPDLTLGRAIIEAGTPGPTLAAALQRIAARVEPVLAGRLAARLIQLAAECRFLIPGVVAALARGDLPTVGNLVAASQAGAELGLGNQVAETTALVELAREHGAVAASAFGAGFGGSVWAMVTAAEAPTFVESWAAAYRSRFPERDLARFFRTRPAIPASALD